MLAISTGCALVFGLVFDDELIASCVLRFLFKLFEVILDRIGVHISFVLIRVGVVETSKLFD